MKILKPLSAQMSDTFLTAALISLSGGLQDAYTYLQRGQVYANAQTGNIILLSQHVIAGEWQLTIRYLVPLLAFALGVAASEITRQKSRDDKRIHWRQLVVLAEIIILFCVGFIPNSFDLLANALVSFACAMQVQAFRKVNGHIFASTMCIGNIRSCVESFCDYFLTKERALFRKGVIYLRIIFMFALGAGIGGLCVPHLGIKTVWLSCALLSLSFGLMFIKKEE